MLLKGAVMLDLEQRRKYWQVELAYRLALDVQTDKKN